jgi:hypothetical protein
MIKKVAIKKHQKRFGGHIFKIPFNIKISDQAFKPIGYIA